VAPLFIRGQIEFGRGDPVDDGVLERSSAHCTLVSPSSSRSPPSPP
jgi:hypothetical protein